MNIMQAAHSQARADMEYLKASNSLYGTNWQAGGYKKCPTYAYLFRLALLNKHRIAREAKASFYVQNTIYAGSNFARVM